MQNHFELFHLPQQFALDLSALNLALREVQSQVHPDKFVNATDAEKRVAMQWATRANEAYQTLKSPLKRAQYLCELNGVDLQIETNTAMPMAFLMQQIEWREALHDARANRDGAALDELEASLKANRNAVLTHMAALLDANDYIQAAQQVRALMFLEKSAEELGMAFDALDN
jgi:molecular chaperone HscB